MNLTPSIYPISKLRYDTLAGYTRRLGAYVLSEELARYEVSNERVVGTLIRDTSDDDCGGIIMGCDEKGCFRCVNVTPEPRVRRLELAQPGGWMDLIA